MLVSCGYRYIIDDVDVPVVSCNKYYNLCFCCYGVAFSDIAIVACRMSRARSEIVCAALSLSKGVPARNLKLGACQTDFQHKFRTSKLN